MSDSQEQVRNLFGLDKEEKILDDFGCTLSEKIPIPGRLYLTEHFICFGSNIFGFNRKYSISFNEITIMSIKKSNIELETKNNKRNKFSFTNFTDIKIVYKRIKSMCRCYNESISTNYLEQKTKEEIIPIILSDSEDSDDESEEIIKTKTSSSSKKTQNSNKDFNILNDDSHKADKENNIIIEKKIDNITKKNPNYIINNNIKKDESINEPKKLEQNIEIEEENEINTSSNKRKNIKNSLNSIKNTKTEPNENKNKNTLDKAEEKKISNIEDEEIIFNPIDPHLDTEICRKIINLNPKAFFEKYQTNTNPETSYKKYYEWVGDYSEITVPDWEKIENQENPGVEKFQRIENFNLSLHGVPLINKSKVIKTLTYWVDEKGAYYMKTSSKSQGVPLSDNFTVETTLEFHPYMNNTKTVFRTYVRTNIIKYTIFKSALISQGKKSYTQEINKWFQFIEEKGEKIEGDYVYKPKKKLNSFGRTLSHGIEKEISYMKSDKHIVDFSDFCEDIYFGAKKYVKYGYEYFYREFDKKTRIILFCFLFIFIMLLSIIRGQSNEIKELKYGFVEMKNILDNLTKLTIELKKELDKRKSN